MKRARARSREETGRWLHRALRFLLGAILSGAQLGGYAPFAVGFAAAAGGGAEGLSALLGTAAGAALFLDFSHALRTAAAGVLVFAANGALGTLRIARKPWFLPALTAGLMLTVEFVYVLRAGAAEAAYCLMSAALAALAAHGSRLALSPDEAQRRQPAALLPLLGVLAALASAQTRGGFAPGRIAAVLAVLCLAFDRSLSDALAAALCVGLAMDLSAGGGGFLRAASYGLGAFAVNRLHRGSRVRAAAAFAALTLLFALPLEAEAGLLLLYENLAGTLAFLLLPTALLRALGAPEPPAEEAPEEESALRRRIAASAQALREVYDSVARVPQPPEENPAAVFDRAAERVCRGCTLCDRCWRQEYGRTYTALNDATPALLRRGEGRGADFPSYFVDRCIRFPSFLAAVNREVSAYLLRRQYSARLAGARAQAAGQYAQLSELLSAAAEGAAPASAAPALVYQVGSALRAKDGERVSGDCMSVFESESGALCLLVSDGMGSGEAAHREAAMAVRLLERFLRAGIEPLPALKTLGGALTLRAELTDSFTTVDLLTLSLRTGEAELYKYGAAPSYVKRGGRVRRVTCAGLPAGLRPDEPAPPETTRFRLEGGSFFVMVTDGVADGTDDEWLQDLLAGWEGENPQLLVSAILADSREHRGGGDDALALALYLPKEQPTAREL